MKKIALYVVLALLLMAHPAFANLVQNGDFETPRVANLSPGFDTYNSNPLPGGFEWLIGNGGSGYQYQGFDHIGNYWPGASGAIGDQSIDIDYQTQVYQDFTTVLGQAYELSFWYSNNKDQGSAQGTVEVKGNSLLLSDGVSHSGASYENMDFTLFKKNFVADSANTRLTFQGDAGNRNWGFVVDNVNVKAVPEPISSALFLLGAGALGLKTFRRKKS